MRIWNECSVGLFKNRYGQFATDRWEVIQKYFQRVASFQVIEDEGIPVAYPEGDQPIGMVASGCVDGRASISLGNSVVFNAVGGKPVLKKRGLVDSFRTADNRHLLMTCMTSGCVVYDELVDCFLGCAKWLGKKTSKDDIRNWLTSEAAKVAAGCDGVFFNNDSIQLLVG